MPRGVSSKTAADRASTPSSAERRRVALPVRLPVDDVVRGDHNPGEGQASGTHSRLEQQPTCRRHDRPSVLRKAGKELQRARDRPDAAGVRDLDLLDVCATLGNEVGRQPGRDRVGRRVSVRGIEDRSCRPARSARPSVPTIGRRWRAESTRTPSQSKMTASTLANGFSPERRDSLSTADSAGGRRDRVMARAPWSTRKDRPAASPDGAQGSLLMIASTTPSSGPSALTRIPGSSRPMGSRILSWSSTSDTGMKWSRRRATRRSSSSGVTSRYANQTPLRPSLRISR